LAGPQLPALLLGRAFYGTAICVRRGVMPDGASEVWPFAKKDVGFL